MWSDSALHIPLRARGQKLLEGAHALFSNFPGFEVGTAGFINRVNIISKGHKPQKKFQGSPLFVST